MTTREEMVRTLENFCDRQEKCNGCLFEKFEDDGQCNFGEWGDSALAVAYNRIYKNGEARLDGSHLKEQDDKPDMVNHPQHYTQGGIECIDALKAATVDKCGIEAVCVANVIKYCWRYEKKNGIEDVRKAKFYLDRLLKELESQQS